MHRLREGRRGGGVMLHNAPGAEKGFRKGYRPVLSNRHDGQGGDL